MVKSVDLTGRRFGLLVGDSRADNSKSGRSQWNCICDCQSGTGSKSRFVVRTDNLLSGKTTSCGCKKTGRPSAEEIAHAPKPLPDNAISEKYQITSYSCPHGVKIKALWGFAVITGGVLKRYLPLEIAGRMKHPASVRGRPVRDVGPYEIWGMDALMDMGLIEDQGTRTYRKWMEDCGVTHTGISCSDALHVEAEYERVMGRKYVPLRLTKDGSAL